MKKSFNDFTFPYILIRYESSVFGIYLQIFLSKSLDSVNYNKNTNKISSVIIFDSTTNKYEEIFADYFIFNLPIQMLDTIHLTPPMPSYNRG